jgi:hypothetical protein
MDDTKGESPRRGNPEWQKGCPSPHPGGRPKKREELVAKIQERGLELVEKLFEIVDDCPVRVPRKGEDGKVEFHIVGPSHRDRIEAAKLLVAYGYGKPLQTVEVSGPEGGPVPVSGIQTLVEKLAEMAASKKG